MEREKKLHKDVQIKEISKNQTDQQIYVCIKYLMIIRSAAGLILIVHTFLISQGIL